MRFLDAGQSLVETLEPESQAAVIDPQLVQDGGIQVIDVDRVVLETGRPMAVLIDDVVAVLVGPTVLDSPFDPSTRKPGGKAAGVMVPPVVGVVLLALAVDRAPELPRADDQRVLKHITCFEVPNQTGPGLIDVQALAPQLGRQRAVVIPPAVEHLHEAYA